MSARSRRKDSGLPRGGSNEIPLYVALALIATATIGLVYLALNGVHIGDRSATEPRPDSTPSSVIAPSATPTAAPNSAEIPVGLVSEALPAWWGRSIDAGLVQGASSGPRIGEAGDDIATMTTQLDLVTLSQGQPVVIQVGSRDIINGASAAEIDASMKALWQGVKDRGGQPIAVLVPPSNVFPGSVVAVNAQIRTSAQAEGVAVLDATTSIAAADGTWAAGFSDDGQQPNALGMTSMVEAVVSQLPELVGSTTASR
jgi:lysophospholipase L1-like esterase